MRERMVTHRKYLSIVTMMAVLLFMFMFTQVAKETVSDYTTNVYAAEPPVSGSLRWEAPGGGSGAPAAGNAAEDAERGRGFILLFGDVENGVGHIVEQWCLYSKRELVVHNSVAGFVLDSERKPELVLIDSNVVDCKRDTPALVELAEQGVNLVFCNLPDVSVIRGQPKLRKLLGIRYVRADEVEVEGIHLFGNFLLGGSYMYILAEGMDEDWQDLDLTMPWYVTITGTKTYMVGMLDEMFPDEPAKNEYFPGVIWRNSYRNAKVFAVNGNYMSDLTGIGILSAMVYETKDYDLYPIINAQNLVMTDYPNFSEENTETIEAIYSRTPRVVQQDIFWPTLLAILRRGGWRLTSFITPQYDYRDSIEPEADNLRFYLQQFKEVGAEAGISLRHGEEVALEEKAERDGAFYRSLDDAYTFSAAYIRTGEFYRLKAVKGAEFTEDLRTISCEYGPGEQLVFYFDDGVTGQSIVSDARVQPYSENVRMRSLETALGYSNVKIDMHDVLWPESGDTHWEKVYEDVASNLDTWWKPFENFQKTTLTESDGRLRTFLNLDYKTRREEDRVHLTVEGVEEDAWFLLRTHGEGVVETTGAECREIERDTYLVHVLEPEAEFRLEKNRGVLKYTLPK